MKGLELLYDAALGEAFTVQTAYGTYPDLIFVGFMRENDDVMLAAFSHASQRIISNPSVFFDISIPSNRVEKV
jgi:hypothetical protein